MEHPTQRLDDSTTEMRCLKCGYPMIEAVVSDYVSLAPANRRLGNMLKGSTCTAHVCSECGYTEFYTKNPRNLLE